MLFKFILFHILLHFIMLHCFVILYYVRQGYHIYFSHCYFIFIFIIFILPCKKLLEWFTFVVLFHICICINIFDGNFLKPKFPWFPYDVKVKMKFSSFFSWKPYCRNMFSGLFYLFLLLLLLNICVNFFVGF